MININCAYDALVKPKDLKEHPKNPNKHSKEQIERLCKILEYQGFRSPIKVSNLSGHITAGHGRLMAAKKLKMKEVPVDYQDYESEEQEYADIVADNAIASWAELDLSFINNEVGSLGPDFDIDWLGLKDFHVEPAEKFEPQSEEDEVPTEVDTRCKPGDVWQLGRHRLMCGDSTSIDAVEKLMDGEKADMVFTDPPYNAQIKQIKNDSFKDVDDFIDFTKSWVAVAMSFLKDKCSFYCWGYWKTICDIKSEVFNGFHDFEFSNLIIWSKPSLKASSSKYKTSYEACLFYQRGSPVFFPQNADTVRKSTQERWASYADEDGWYDPKGNGKKSNINFHVATDIWEDIPTMGRGGNKEYLRVHPTQKPIKACERAILSSSDQSMKILDLFGGSGSTLIACEKTNRKCFMMELDPHYCDVIITRWEQYTGQKAKRITTDSV